MGNDKDKIMRKGMRDLILKYPVTLLKKLNLGNISRFFKAVRHEPPKQIINNINIFLRRSKNTNINNLKKEIITFVKKIELNNREPILFVSHEATRTGAPLIIKTLAEQMKMLHNVLPIFILCTGGELEKTFVKIGPTYLLSFFDEFQPDKQEMSLLISELIEKTKLKVAYVNSAESRNILPHLRKNRIKKIITLVHELGHYYPKDAFQVINDYSDKIIFPAKFVEEKAYENTSIDKHKIIIRGQGLLKPEILQANKQISRAKIRKELALPKDCLIVLGCGTPDARKGIDLFVMTAISTIYLLKNKKDVRFIWLGDTIDNEYKTWTQRDIQQAKLLEKILFIGSRTDTIPFFSGSDLFFLTSRGDPFPCVVHEAIAAGIPTIAFKNAGGSVEMIEEGILGSTIDYGNIIKASNTIIDYLAKYQKDSNIEARKAYAKEHLMFESYTKELINYIRNN